MKSGVLALCLIAIVSAEDYYYGNFLCGNCADGVRCGSDGKCPNNKCIEGWAGDDCQTPLCDDVSCSESAGKCYDHNKCACFKNYAQNTDDMGCHSMRTAGLKGALCALVVVFSAIGICGGIQQSREKSGKIKI